MTIESKQQHATAEVMMLLTAIRSEVLGCGDVSWGRLAEINQVKSELRNIAQFMNIKER